MSRGSYSLGRPATDLTTLDQYRPIQKKQLCQTVRSTSVARCRRTSVRRDCVRIVIRRSSRQAVAETACEIPPRRASHPTESHSLHAREPSYMCGDLILTHETYQVSRHDRPSETRGWLWLASLHSNSSYHPAVVPHTLTRPEPVASHSQAPCISPRSRVLRQPL